MQHSTSVMQLDLLQIPPSDETEEALKARLDRIYRIYGQDWRPFFEKMHAREPKDEEADPMPWWLIDRARQLGSTSSPER